MKLFIYLGVFIMMLTAGASISSAQPSEAFTKTWPIVPEKSRTAVVFIEFQKEWLAEDGLLFRNLVVDKTELRSAVSQAETVLLAARKYGWHIVHAGLDMRNDPTYQVFAGGKNVLGLRAAIPAAKTWIGSGADFFAPFIPEKNEFVVSGRSGASIFAGSNLASYLKSNQIDTLILMGFATHVCVESSLRAAHDAGYNVYIVTDASAAFTKEQDAFFTKHILHHFGAGVSASQFVNLLER